MVRAMAPERLEECPEEARGEPRPLGGVDPAGRASRRELAQGGRTQRPPSQREGGPPRPRRDLEARPVNGRGNDGPVGRKARARPATANQPAALSRGQVATVESARGSLLLSAPRTARVPRYLAWDERVGSWRTEALNHAQLREDAAEYRLHLEDHAERYFDCPTLRSSLPPLRPDQEAAIAAWEEAGQRGVIVKPTGTGKTEIALGIIARHRVSTLIVAPLRDLMYQWQRRIRQGLGFDAGVLGDGRREIWPITVTTYDSAWIHMKDMGNRYRLMVFDE